MSEAFDSEEMVAIPIHEFVSSSAIPVDLYLRLSEQKYVLIAKQDSPGAAAQLQALEHKNIEKLFVRREEFNRYVSSSIVIAGVAISQREISAAKKADFLARSSAAVLTEIDALGLNPESYEHARLLSVSTTTLIEAKSDLFGILQALSGCSDATFAHSIGTSAMAVIIGRAVGWTKPATFEKLALGALLHDIGCKELPAELLAKPRAFMTADEIQLYETHPFRGMEILRSIPSAPDDVIAIAYEHQENAIGQGYPRKLRDLRMNPLAKVVALADAFAELTLRSGGLVSTQTPVNAVIHIESVMGQPFNREAFSALKMLVQKNARPATYGAA